MQYLFTQPNGQTIVISKKTLHTILYALVLKKLSVRGNNPKSK